MYSFVLALSGICPRGIYVLGGKCPGGKCGIGDGGKCLEDKCLGALS